MKEHLRVTLLKMCEYVNADFDSIDFSKQEWYYEHLWTDEQQNEFKAWMIDYLKKNKEARYELLANSTANKTRIEKAVNEFIFNYGWETE